jgi:photosystem II stability/assembly factor-like uncharacterized protein
MTDPLLTAFTRVHLIKGRAGPDRAPKFEGCMKMTALDWPQGDVTKVECPDPTQYGKFIEVGKIKASADRPSTTLVGRYSASVLSELMDLAKNGCPSDVQLHIGKCQSADIFNSFTKAIIFEDLDYSNYGTDDLGALEGGENEKVNETLDISAKNAYEVVPLSFGVKAGAIVTTEIVDGKICDQISCGDCDDMSGGCEKLYAITKNANGSPGQPADIVFSIDGGANWCAHDIDTLGVNDPNAMECFGDYIVVVSNADNALHYVPKSELNCLVDPAWAHTHVGFVANGEPNAIWAADSNWAFIVGDTGYVYLLTDPTAGVTVLDAGAATTSNLLAVSGIPGDRNFAVAVGADGVVLMTENGSTWEALAGPVGIGTHLYCVAVKSAREWWVGASNGNLYYTKDGGDTWALKGFPGSGSGSVRAIKIATDSVFYLSHKTAAVKGRILRSFNGGYSWIILPEGDGTIPAADQYNFLAPCPSNPNFLFAGGLGDDNVDGILVIGEPKSA